MRIKELNRKELNRNWILVSLLSLLSTGGCSTASKSSAEIPVDAVERDYVLRERNPDPAQDWIRNWSKFKRENENHGNNYFVGESGDVSDRVAGCNLAMATGRSKIAQQIATLITDKLAATKAGQLVIDKDNPNDPGMRKHFEQTIASMSEGFISGSKEEDQYWEERDYSKGGGKKRVYICKMLVKIDDKSLADALRKAGNKTTDVVEDVEAKAVVKEALKDVDKTFKEYQDKSN